MAIKLSDMNEVEDSALEDPEFEAPPIVRFDERRMHVRAYNYWASLLGDHALPSIEDLNPTEIMDFGSHSVLLDFTSGREDPAIAFLGTALAAQCDVAQTVDRVSLIPARTLLSRLTDHFLQIIANAAPISFEAEFTNQRDVEILYRGIMLPFSSDGDTIDFVYGVINWKEMASEALSHSIAAEVEASLKLPTHIVPPAPATPSWADGPAASDDDEPFELSADLIDESWANAADPDAELADHLAAARDAVGIALTAEGRGRQALYRAIGLAHAFALLAQVRRDDYLELLADAGLAENAKSPTASLVRLVFGADYDKTRMAEFARAIDHAVATGVAPGAFSDVLGSLPGGLKGYVAQARAAARGDAAPSPVRRATRSRNRLARKAPMAPDALDFDESQLAIAVMRRAEDGSIEVVAGLSAGDRLAERVLNAVTRTR